MPEESSDRKTETDINVHIFNTSAQMVGVCLTVIGIIAIIVKLKDISTFVDDLVALNAASFLCSCGLSYLALRTKGVRHRAFYGKVADIVFLVSLLFMAFICVLVALELIAWR